MDWQFTVKWTLLIITLSEGCNDTCPCSCNCLTSTASTIKNSSDFVTNATNISTTANKTTHKPSTASSDTSTITPTLLKSPSSVTRILTTFSTVHSTIPWLNTSNVTCNGSLYTIYKQSNLNYEVINVTAYVGGYVTLQNCTRTDTWYDVEWIKYGTRTHQLCRIGSYHSTSPLNGMCLDCNRTSLTIYNVTVEHAGKYVLHRYSDGKKENYYLTVLWGTTTSSPIPDKCKTKEESDQHRRGAWDDVITTVKNTNIPLGIHAVWAGIVVSVALVALYMGSRRASRKPRYKKLPKYDPDEFWTKT
ncbi:membrane protein RL13 [Human betaherpesvirus 5]|nr:membrane protein RL13 [Human betaherpesvirus 5]